MAAVIWPRVLGQQRVKMTLLSATRSGRLPHAYLFYGDEGVGKDAMAIELARVIHCELGGDEACGVCPSCTKLDDMQHPDVQLITALPLGKSEVKGDSPLAKLTQDDLSSVREEYRNKGENPYRRISIPRANTIKINSVREVRREATMTAFGGRKRVFIISRADEMNDDASNALLKTLEEPAGDCIIILTTSSRESLLPTIISRCQQVRFDPLTEENIQTGLVERNGVEAGRASLIARLANGSYQRAVELLEADVFEERAFVVSFIRNALSGNAVSVIGDVDTIAGWKDRDRVVRFLMLVLVWFRDALVLSRGGAVINADQLGDLQRFVTRNPDADLMKALTVTERALSLVNRNTYIKLVLLYLATNLHSIVIRTR